MNKIKGLILAGSLALMSSSAFAIPFTVDITVTGSGGGIWSILGPLFTFDDNQGGFPDGLFGPGTTSLSGELDPGTYVASIAGAAGGIFSGGTVDWLITVGGQTILSGFAASTTEERCSRFFGCYDAVVKDYFGQVDKAVAVPVPEPGTLALLGIGLLGLGFSARRRTKLS